MKPTTAIDLLLSLALALIVAVLITESSENYRQRVEIENRLQGHEIRLSDLERYSHFVDKWIDRHGETCESDLQVLRGQVSDLIRRAEEAELQLGRLRGDRTPVSEDN